MDGNLKSFMQFYYRMEYDQVKERLEDTYVTDKEITLKSDRFASLENNHIAIQYKTLASAMLPIYI